MNPEVVVPGHGPITDVSGVKEMKGYQQYVGGESKTAFDQGLSSTDAAGKMDIGPYVNWAAPARLWMNVERAYREFRGEPGDAPWEHKAAFDAITNVAKAQGFPVEF